jgi:diaminohydroxyphosphoribosylaminopyrimidine deaminase/5-amino-6-(5-phosphoribosylamino)uracil reductase
VSDLDRHWMRRAIELSRRCPPVTRAYSVGAVIVDSSGRAIAGGHSREIDPHVHAEEAALHKIHGDADRSRLIGATLYTTLEPCSTRASRRTPCAQLAVASGVRRVVFAWREPALFVPNCQGAAILRRSGIEVIELLDLAEEARTVNAHLAI